MATSGTYNFLMTRDELISAALRLTTKFGAGDVIPAEDITNVAQALQILCKSLAKNSLPLWCVTQFPVPLIAGQATYNLSTLSGTRLPLRILNAFIRDANGQDTNLALESRYDYDLLGNKAATGVPNQGYYDPQLDGGTLTLYNTPADSTETVYVTIQRQIQDITAASDNPDFPQEAYQMLKWILADEIALEYTAPMDVRLELARKAKVYKEEFQNSEQEFVSVTFQPSGRRR